MKYLFEVLGDNEALGKAEILAVAESYPGTNEVLENEDGILAVDTSLSSETFEKRLGLTRTISEYLTSGDQASITEFFNGYKLEAENFCVRAKRITSNQPDVSTSDFQRQIGDILSKTAKVELENPSAEFRIIISKKLHAGLKIAEIERKSFEDRKVQYRPFFSPISLHPKLARALVNLSSVKEGETVFDPFCGTGGILIEAGLMGVKIMGSDIDETMVEGCKDNLKSYKLEGKVFEADVSDISDIVESVDAIITDPPYGRSASTGGETIMELYRRSFQSFKKVLKKGGRLAIILPLKIHIELCKEFFKLKEVFEVRVHGSLTRFFSVFENL